MNKRIYNEKSAAIFFFPNPFSAMAKPTFVLLFFQGKLSESNISWNRYFNGKYQTALMKSRDISSAFNTPRYLLVLLTSFERRLETVKASLPATGIGQLLGLPLPLHTAVRSLGKNHKSLVIFAGGSCTWGSRCRILPYGTANTMQICAKPAISCAVFIARKLQGGLMAWTNCCLALIGLFSLSKWFSGGSVV